MSFCLRGFGITAAVLLSGCAHWAHWKVPPTDSSLSSEGACPDWRWIGIKADREAACPELEGWTERSLFEPRIQEQKKDPYGRQDPKETRTSLGVDPRSDPVPPGLRAFCLYERDERRGGEDFRRLMSDKLVSASQDCSAVAMSAGRVLDDNLVPQLRQRFLTQAGSLAVTLGRNFPAESEPRVRLTLIDTEPFEDGVEGRSAHGKSLARMARELLCRDAEEEPGPGCVAEVTTELATTITRTRPLETDPVRGGYLGFIGELAEAVRRGVSRWDPAAQPRLVLNLSLGWNGELFDGLSIGQNEEPVACNPVAAGAFRDLEAEAAQLAVYCALQDAACRGALIVAAAGNAAWGPPEPVKDGALLPAAWQARPRPSAEHCAALLGPTADLDDDLLARPAPLLHAVGGVRSNGSRLYNSRPGSEPRLVAFADHAVARNPDGSPTATLTGSSVAALVVSAAAAGAWHFRSDLTPGELGEYLYTSGRPLGRPAELWRGATPPEVHQVTLDGSLIKVCAGASNCPTGLSAGPRSSRPILFGSGALPPTGVPSFTLTPGRFYVEPICGGKTVYYRGARPRYPCPHHQLHTTGSEPWTGPQPDDAPCPRCPEGAGSPCHLTLHIPADWGRGGDVSAARLRDVTLEMGDTIYALSDLLPSLDLRPGSVVTIDGIPFCDSPGLSADTPLVLGFRLEHPDYADPVSIASPVLYVERPP